MGVEPIRSESQSEMLPLHHSHTKENYYHRKTHSVLIRHLQESNLLPQILGLYQRTNALGLNVFIYGRGTENRTLIDRLKADYSTFELYPHMVPPLRIELSLLGLRVRYATVTSRRDGFVNIFFYVPSWTIRGSRMTL